MPKRFNHVLVLVSALFVICVGGLGVLAVVELVQAARSTKHPTTEPDPLATIAKELPAGAYDVEIDKNSAYGRVYITFKVKRGDKAYSLLLCRRTTLEGSTEWATVLDREYVTDPFKESP